MPRASAATRCASRIPNPESGAQPASRCSKSCSRSCCSRFSSPEPGARSARRCTRCIRAKPRSIAPIACASPRNSCADRSAASCRSRTDTDESTGTNFVFEGNGRFRCASSRRCRVIFPRAARTCRRCASSAAAAAARSCSSPIRCSTASSSTTRNPRRRIPPCCSIRSRTANSNTARSTIRAISPTGPISGTIPASRRSWCASRSRCVPKRASCFRTWKFR